MRDTATSSQDTQKFMFIDLSSTKDASRQSQVLSHVRQNYHKQQRREKIDRLRDLTVASSHFSPGKLPFPRKDPKISDTKSKLDDNKLTATLRRRTMDGLAPGRSLSISTHCGNSDPFNVYAIKIEPEINEVIAFYRDFTLPAQYHVPSEKWVSSASATLDWSICLSTLQAPDLATAFIARAATIAAVLSPRLRPFASQQRLRSIQQLRVKLMNNESHELSDSDLLQIVMLQKVEIVEKNLAAASAHARMLQFLFQERLRVYGTFDLTLLQYALWSDVQISTSFMSPLSFDVDSNGWVERTLQPAWTSALREFASIPEWDALRREAEAGLDDCVEGRALRDFFVSRRTTLRLWLHFGLRGLPVPTRIMFWLASTATVQQGRMIKHYLKAIDHVSGQIPETQAPGADEDKEVENWYAQQYLILAEFIWTHHLSFKVEIGGIDLFDPVPTLLIKLRKALEYDTDSPKYQNARLWALFLGYHAESQALRIRRTSKGNTSARRGDDRNTTLSKHDDSCEDHWFKHNLALQLRHMSLVSWADVNNILEAFNYADIIKPVGEDLLAQAFRWR